MVTWHRSGHSFTKTGEVVQGAALARHSHAQGCYPTALRPIQQWQKATAKPPPTSPPPHTHHHNARHASAVAPNTAVQLLQHDRSDVELVLPADGIVALVAVRPPVPLELCEVWGQA